MPGGVFRRPAGEDPQGGGGAQQGGVRGVGRYAFCVTLVVASRPL